MIKTTYLWSTKEEYYNSTTQQAKWTTYTYSICMDSHHLQQDIGAHS
jgi:hypothetical protein